MCDPVAVYSKYLQVRKEKCKVLIHIQSQQIILQVLERHFKNRKNGHISPRIKNFRSFVLYNCAFSIAVEH